MVLAPVLLLIGVLLRLQFHFFFPQQLAAFAQHPSQMTAAYNFYLAGIIILWPAVATLAWLIGRTRPGWALWGGVFVIFGLFARTFYAGADYMAFQMVRPLTTKVATETVAGSYGAFHLVSALNGAILFGWIILAIGTYLSGTLGLIRSIALALMSMLMMGVLKGSSWTSVVATSGLCIALVPLGVKLLRASPSPRLKAVLGWVALMMALIALLFVLGQLG
ncbi:MAG TPA: hypothetical protein VFI20_02665 [Terracidiphilus sp.]|nr:hypothetical protein [Terracidiphilus sp.]